jgi:hypothetical protein
MKYRFLLIQAFHLPEGSPYLHRPVKGTKEARLMNHERVAPLLADVEWELHPGPPAPYGNWPVESREEFALVAAGRLPIVRAACESGKYNAIVLLGGGEPGFQEAREIARPHNIPVTACAWSQMHVASLLGNRFGIIRLFRDVLDAAFPAAAARRDGVGSAGAGGLQLRHHAGEGDGGHGAFRERADLSK